MDIIATQDQAVCTDVPLRKHKEERIAERLRKAAGANVVPKIEKKRVESKRLKKKLIEIEEQNDCLNKIITDKNLEINELRKSVNSLNDVLNSVPIDELRCNSSIATTKLLELSKKNRQLRAELETMKNRISKKDMQIQRLEKEVKSAEEKSQQDADPIKKLVIIMKIFVLFFFYFFLKISILKMPPLIEYDTD